MLKNLKKSKSEGFTIIEVMIVLAIAGLILLIVFLAVPALQRNARNTQKKNDASNVLGAIGEQVSNNNGTVPVAGDVANIQSAANLSNGTTINVAVPSSSANIVVPSSSEIEIVTGAKCVTGANQTKNPLAVSDYQGVVTFTNVSSRSYVVLFSVEAAGGKQTTQCLGS